MVWLLFLIFPLQARSEVLHEFYYKIFRKGEHVGFSCRREEQDPGTKEWIFRTYVFTWDRDRLEHHIKLTTRSAEDFAPVESIYEEKEGVEKPKTTKVKINISGSNILLKFKDDQTKAKEGGVLDPNGILSDATYRVLLRNSPKKGQVFRFSALKEDTGKQTPGHLQVRDVKTIQGQKLYQIVNDYELFTEEVWLTSDGQKLFTRLTNVDVTEEMAADASEAVGSLPVNRSEMTALFGEIPAGKKNWLITTKLKRDPKWFRSDFKIREISDSKSIPLRRNPDVSK
ncbi:MAG: hypothetical protein AB7F86_05170 [Bdellovibrionales bacterium]